MTTEEEMNTFNTLMNLSVRPYRESYITGIAPAGELTKRKEVITELSSSFIKACYMVLPYGQAIWHCHMAEPNVNTVWTDGLRADGRAVGRACLQSDRRADRWVDELILQASQVQIAR